MAETYPSRPVRIVVGLPAGNSPDIVSRLISQMLSERLGQPFVVENRPGANTNIATELVVRAPPDGYTLLFEVAGNAINSSVYKNLNYNFDRDIVPVASVGGIPLVMVVTPGLPVKTVPEFVAYVKANPGKVFMGSSGNGSTLHVAGALFAMMTGIELPHVPYKESIFPDLLGGQVQLAFEPVPAVLGYVQSGKLRALGVSMPRRLGSAARCSCDRRIRAGLSGQRLARPWRAKGHAGRHRRHTQQDDQRGHGRSQVQDAPERYRRRDRPDDAGRLCEIHCRRNAEVGEGGCVRAHNR